MDSNQNGSAGLTSVGREQGSYCVAGKPTASSLAYVARSRVALGAKLSSKLLGFPNVRNYDGSWTEYGSVIGVPIENPSVQVFETVTV